MITKCPESPWRASSGSGAPKLDLDVPDDLPDHLQQIAEAHRVVAGEDHALVRELVVEDLHAGPGCVFDVDVLADLLAGAAATILRSRSACLR